MKVSSRLLKRKNQTLGTIMIAVYYKGQRKEFSFGRQLQEQEWNSRRQEAIGSQYQMLNVQLRNLKRDITSSIDEAVVQHGVVDITNIVNKIIGKSSVKEEIADQARLPILVDYIQAQIDNNPERLKIASLSNYKSLRSLILEFKPNILVSEVDVQFVNNLHSFMETKSMQVNTIETRMSKLRKIINSALREGLTTIYPFGLGKYTLHKDVNIRRKYLKDDEISALVDFIPTNQSEIKVLSIIKFNLHLGLRIKDVLTLRKSDIVLDINKVLKSTTYRCTKITSKTGTGINIPLSDQAVNELKNNGFDTKQEIDLIFPWLVESDFDTEKTLFDAISANTAYFNKVLAKMCHKLSIPRISSHSIRHSFATTLINNDVPITSISKMMAHKSIATTQIYSQLVQETIDSHLSVFNNKKSVKKSDISKF